MYPTTFYRVSVKALIKDAHNNILVVKENQDTWSLPGGGLDHGEDPRTGILRELREELGIEAAVTNEVINVKTLYLAEKAAWLLWIVYEVEIDSKEFTLGEGVTAAQYIGATDLAESDDVFEKLVYSVAKEHNIA